MGIFKKMTLIFVHFNVKKWLDVHFVANKFIKVFEIVVQNKLKKFFITVHDEILSDCPVTDDLRRLCSFVCGCF